MGILVAKKFFIINSNQKGEGFFYLERIKMNFFTDEGMWG